MLLSGVILYRKLTLHFLKYKWLKLKWRIEKIQFSFCVVIFQFVNTVNTRLKFKPEQKLSEFEFVLLHGALALSGEAAFFLHNAKIKL